MFAKFYEILSLSFQDIEKPKRRGRTNGRTDNVKTVYPNKHSLWGGGGTGKGGIITDTTLHPLT